MRRLLPLGAVLLAGCGAGGSPGATQTGAGAAAARTTGATASRTTPRATTPSATPTSPTAPPPLRPARCPPAAAACSAASGTVLAVESVDPDGDGDLHVIAVGGSVTAPGVTVYDVARALRPARDPRPGDRVTGAGPVFRGSHGQRQVQVTEFRVSRARG